jgi:hypothetical protein
MLKRIEILVRLDVYRIQIWGQLVSINSMLLSALPECSSSNLIIERIPPYIRRVCTSFGPTSSMRLKRFSSIDLAI